MITTLVNLRLEQHHVDVLDRLAGAALNRQAVARMLLIAAIEATERNQGRLHFPPSFEVSDKSAALQSEPPPRTKSIPHRK